MSGHTTETAPKRVWLQVNPEAMLDEETGGVEGDDEPFPQEEVTWCWHSIGGLEVEYVRADLVRAAMPINATDPGDPELQQLAELLGMTANNKVQPASGQDTRCAGNHEAGSAGTQG